MLLPLFTYLYRSTGYYSYYIKYHKNLFFIKNIQKFWNEYRLTSSKDLTFAEFIDINLKLWDFRNGLCKDFTV